MNHTTLYVLMFLMICIPCLAYQANIEDVKINISVSSNTVTLRSPAGNTYVFSGTSNDSLVWNVPDFKWNLSEEDYNNLTGNRCPDLKIASDAFKCSPSMNYTINVPAPVVEVKVNASTFNTEDREDLAALKVQMEDVQSDVNSLKEPVEPDSPLTKEYYGMPLWFILALIVIIGGVALYARKNLSKPKEIYIPVKGPSMNPVQKTLKQSEVALPELENYKSRKATDGEHHDKVVFHVADNNFEKDVSHDKIIKEVALALDEEKLKEQLESEKKELQEAIVMAAKPKPEANDIKDLKSEITALRAALKQVKG